jgi:hypothetical protein
LGCRQVCKTCAFHDALQAGKQKESTHRTPLIWRLRATIVSWFYYKIALYVSSTLRAHHQEYYNNCV